jgi:hypothetical protein
MLVYVDYETYYGQMKKEYDFVKCRPSSEFSENADRAKKTLKDLGLDLEA